MLLYYFISIIFYKDRTEVSTNDIIEEDATNQQK